MTSSFLTITPVASLRVSRYQIPAYGLIPNTSIQNRPLLIYHCAFSPSSSSPSATASAIEDHLTSVGVVTPQWRYTMYSTTHFHSTTHEVLCVSSGEARLCFGGEGNDPGKVVATARPGDVLVVPAGVGHRLLEDMSKDGETFEMVGSYPTGCRNWDMCYGKKGEESKVRAIADLKWFERDPIYGGRCPVLES